LATPVFTASQMLPKMPSCLPRNSPAAMPSGSGSSRIAGDRPSNDTPALAKPKSGTIRNADQGCSACSSLWSGESTASGAAGDLTSGIVIAAATPAMVACTPDWKTSTHSTTASAR